MHRQQPNYDYSVCEVYIYICIIKITKKNNLIFHIDLWYLDKSRFWKANYMHYKHIYNIIYIYISWNPLWGVLGFILCPVSFLTSSVKSALNSCSSAVLILAALLTSRVTSSYLPLIWVTQNFRKVSPFPVSGQDNKGKVRMRNVYFGNNKMSGMKAN